MSVPSVATANVMRVGHDVRCRCVLLGDGVQEPVRGIKLDLVAAPGADHGHLLDLARIGRLPTDVVNRDARVAGVAGVQARAGLVDAEPADSISESGTARTNFSRPELLKL